MICRVRESGVRNQLSRIIVPRMYRIATVLLDDHSMIELSQFISVQLLIFLSKAKVSSRTGGVNRT